MQRQETKTSQLCWHPLVVTYKLQHSRDIIEIKRKIHRHLGGLDQNPSQNNQGNLASASLKTLSEKNQRDKIFQGKKSTEQTTGTTRESLTKIIIHAAQELAIFIRSFPTGKT